MQEEKYEIPGMLIALTKPYDAGAVEEKLITSIQKIKGPYSRTGPEDKGQSAKCT